MNESQLFDIIFQQNSVQYKKDIRKVEHWYFAGHEWYTVYYYDGTEKQFNIE